MQPLDGLNEAED